MGNPKPNCPSFFKVMMGDFATTVRIPPEFKKHLGESITQRSVVMRNSGGRQWRIKMGIADGHVYFQNGWERFISANSIRQGDFLVFFYDGKFGFDVIIYGATCCEKEACVDIPSERVAIKVESEDSDEEQSASPKGVGRKRKVKKMMTENKMCYKVLRGAKPVANEKAMKAACAFKSPHPHFVTTCRTARTNYMTIPLELAKKCNLYEKDEIILRDPHGTSWPVRLSTWRDGRLCLSSGWSNIYGKNRLNEGDVCVLEFVQGCSAINVHFFRAEEYNAKSIPVSHERPRDIKESVPRPLTADYKESVANAPESSESSHPKFTILWKSNQLYHVRIPKKVAEEAGLISSRNTTLIDPSGKSWAVDIILRSYGQLELGIGLSSFSRGNNLAEGDKCEFEIFAGDYIRVHIIRAGETNNSGTDG